jgi:hypothetical protein
LILNKKFKRAPKHMRKMVQDDLKLLDDSGEVPKPNGVVGNSIPDHEIVYFVPKQRKKRKRLNAEV